MNQSSNSSTNEQESSNPHSGNSSDHSFYNTNTLYDSQGSSSTQQLSSAGNVFSHRNFTSEGLHPITFPQQLMEVLSNADLSEIVTWLPHGQGWIIIDKKRFAEEVLPQYFGKRTKWTSFTRKLNRWSFTRVTRGSEVGAYYHPLFKRDNPLLCSQMTNIGSRTPQNLEPLNPVALGLATPNMISQGFSHMVQSVHNSTSGNSHNVPTPLHIVAHSIPTATSGLHFNQSYSMAHTGRQEQTVDHRFVAPTTTQLASAAAFPLQNLNLQQQQQQQQQDQHQQSNSFMFQQQLETFQLNQTPSQGTIVPPIGPIEDLTFSILPHDVAQPGVFTNVSTTEQSNGSGSSIDPFDTTPESSIGPNSSRSSSVDKSKHKSKVKPSMQAEKIRKRKTGRALEALQAGYTAAMLLEQKNNSKPPAQQQTQRQKSEEDPDELP